jgi:hypothetical protein
VSAPEPRPIERQWREYRELALPKAAAPLCLRTARLAFYAAVAATLAELARHRFSIEAVEALSADVDALMREIALESTGREA